MPKLPTVTDEELKRMDDLASGLLVSIHDVSGRLEKGYASPFEDARAVLMTYIALSRDAADLASKILGTIRIQERQREIDDLKAKSGW